MVNKQIRQCLLCKGLTKNLKYCSKKCMDDYNRKHKVGPWYDSKFQKQMSSRNVKKHSKNKTGMFSIETKKKVAATNKKNKTGWYDPKVQSLGGLRAKELGVGWNSKASHAKSSETCKQQGVGVFGLTSKDRKRMVKKSLLTLRQNRGQCYFGQYYDSKGEAEIGLCIYHQLEKIKEEHNFQFRVGRKFIDFFIQKYKCFIEYHPGWGTETKESYFKARRKVLDDNGYKDCNLVVIP